MILVDVNLLLYAKVSSTPLRGPGGGSRMVSDAHLAALAVEHGLVVFSSDADFGRFPEARWEKPLL